MKQALGLTLIALIFVLAACGTQSSPSGPSTQYVADRDGESLEESLRSDSRIVDFQIEGEKLVVNVNEFWASSPPGLKQHALGQWFAKWQSERKGTQVLVRYQGEDIARATSRGIELLKNGASK
jgi:hypothetical protein